MGKLDNGSEDMTGLDRVRRQIDRALNRNDPFEAERKKQVELREEVEQLLAQHNLSSMSLEKGQQDNDPSIVDQLIEIKSLLSKQEYAYQEQKDRGNSETERLVSTLSLSGAENFSILNHLCSNELISQKEKALTLENSTCFSNFSRFLRDAQAGRILHQGIGTSLGSFKAL